MTIAPQVIPGLAKLADSAAANTASLMREAYEMGRDDMRRELAALLAPSREGGNASPTIGGHGGAIIPRTSAKAPPGTVRPAILNIIMNSGGLQTEQIIRATGFKENSVRGTISTLAKEGKIERRLNGWIAKVIEAPTNELKEASNSLGT